MGLKIPWEHLVTGTITIKAKQLIIAAISLKTQKQSCLTEHEPEWIISLVIRIQGWKKGIEPSARSLVRSVLVSPQFFHGKEHDNNRTLKRNLPTSTKTRKTWSRDYDEKAQWHFGLIQQRHGWQAQSRATRLLPTQERRRPTGTAMDLIGRELIKKDQLICSFVHWLENRVWQIVSDRSFKRTILRHQSARDGGGFPKSSLTGTKGRWPRDLKCEIYSRVMWPLKFEVGTPRSE
jgi:hypothetical protein